MKSVIRLLAALTVFAWTVSGSAPASSQKTTEPDISVLSWNVRIDFTGKSWPRREPAIASVVQGGAYDLILFQEASEFMIGRYARMLPNHRYIAGERSDGLRGDQDWYEYMPIFYDPERLQLQRSGSFWVNEDPFEPGGILPNSKNHARVFTWAIFQIKGTTQRFAVGNTHVHGERASYGLDLVNVVFRAYVGNLPFFYAGDFNSDPSSEAYRKMTSEDAFDYLDAWRHATHRAGQDATTLSTDECVMRDPDPCRFGDRARRIDYVFASDAVRIPSYTLIRPPHTLIRPPAADAAFPSDHFPIAVDLSFDSTARDAR